MFQPSRAWLLQQTYAQFPAPTPQLTTTCCQGRRSPENDIPNLNRTQKQRAFIQLNFPHAGGLSICECKPLVGSQAQLLLSVVEIPGVGVCPFTLSGQLYLEDSNSTIGQALRTTLGVSLIHSSYFYFRPDDKMSSDWLPGSGSWIWVLISGKQKLRPSLPNCQFAVCHGVHLALSLVLSLQLSFRRSNVLLWPPWALHTNMVQIHAHKMPIHIAYDK